MRWTLLETPFQAADHTPATVRSGHPARRRVPDGPRYCPERRLPGQRYVPGQGPHPSTRAPSVPEPEAWDGDEATLRGHPDYLWGVDLYNQGYYWEAHEAWEDLWRQVETDTRPRRFLQGLIQCTAAALKEIGRASCRERV